jgi:hypothetical protein
MLRRRSHDDPLPPALRVRLEHQLRRPNGRTGISGKQRETGVVFSVEDRSSITLRWIL